MPRKLNEVKHQILSALEHPEAEDGLYLRNFANLHEEDERPAVEADQMEILEALNELVQEGKVILDESCEEVVFHLARGDKGATPSHA
jgi:hypothetical protein